MDLSWMAWTTPTALFFVGIAIGLIVMTTWEIVSPTVRRAGFLGFATSRGDRFFLALLSNAFLHLVWLGLIAAPVWIASILGVAWLVALIRWG